MKNLVRNIRSVAALLLIAVLNGACSPSFEEKSLEKSVASRRQPTAEQLAQANAKMIFTIQEVGRMAAEGNLNSMVLKGEWQGLDAYYSKVATMACSDLTKKLLKQKALYGMVGSPYFLKDAPLEKREFYANELLAQPHPQPELVVRMADNLKSTWPTDKLARVKEQAGREINASLERIEAVSARLETPGVNKSSSQVMTERKKASLAALKQDLFQM